MRAWRLSVSLTTCQYFPVPRRFLRIWSPNSQAKGPTYMLHCLFTAPHSQHAPSGLISKEAVARAKGLVREALLTVLDDDVAFDRWFGAQVTRWVSKENGVVVVVVVVVGVLAVVALVEVVAIDGSSCVCRYHAPSIIAPIFGPVPLLVECTVDITHHVHLRMMLMSQRSRPQVRRQHRSTRKTWLTK